MNLSPVTYATLEHIDRVNNQADEVAGNLEQGKQVLGKINGFWSRLGDKMSKRKSEKKAEKQKKEEEKKLKEEEKKAAKEEQKKTVESETPPVTTEQTVTETQAPSAVANPYHDEVDDELEEIHSMVKGLKQMAMDAGTEINRQSQKIDDMSDR